MKTKTTIFFFDLQQESNLRDNMLIEVLNSLHLLNKEDPEFSSFLSNVAFVPTFDGTLKAPKELCDPEVAKESQKKKGKQ